jgi:ketosteroid isomerase-like protein
MTTVEDLDRMIEKCRLALDEFVKGDPAPMKEMFSHREDVSFANPLGPPARGWGEVAETMDRAASNFTDGARWLPSRTWRNKYVTPELTYTVWLERQQARVGGRRDVTPFVLRVTMIYRHEDSTWKVVHRHADTVTIPRPAESMIQE